MDDHTKIRVLMIYYEHWGKEEIRAEQIRSGINKTMDLLSDYDLDCLFRCFYENCHSEDISFLWLEFANIFLQQYGECLEPMNGLFDDEDLLFLRHETLKKNIGIHEDSMLPLPYTDTLSVDAIVAWM